VNIPKLTAMRATAGDHIDIVANWSQTNSTVISSITARDIQNSTTDSLTKILDDVRSTMNSMSAAYDAGYQDGKNSVALPQSPT